MGKYSIKELERLSGIKAHTIRIWEKRYKIVEPRRTQTNIRFYSDDDLKKIINVSALRGHGFKISQIAGLSPDRLHRQVLELTASQSTAEPFIEQMIVSMIDLEEERFDKLFLTLTLRFGFERTMLEVVYPFLERIGVLWQTNNITPAQEHFISHLIRQKLMVAIDSQPPPRQGAGRVVLFLPEHELHEIGLLFCCYLCRLAGLRTCYLGASVPTPAVVAVGHQLKPAVFITSATTPRSVSELRQVIQVVCKAFPDALVVGSGGAIQSIRKGPSNFRVAGSALDVRKLVASA